MKITQNWWSTKVGQEFDKILQEHDLPRDFTKIGWSNRDQPWISMVNLGYPWLTMDIHD